jgi:hypothetical protein
MITESQDYAGRIQWFTSLVGRKKSLKPLSQLFRDLGISFRVTTFYQGKTTRWAVAWTFSLLNLEAASPGSSLTIASASVSQTFLQTANMLTVLGIDYDANFQEHWFDYSATEKERSDPGGEPSTGPSLPPTAAQSTAKESKLVLSKTDSGVCLTFRPPNPKLLVGLKRLFTGS